MTRVRKSQTTNSKHTNYNDKKGAHAPPSFSPTRNIISNSNSNKIPQNTVQNINNNNKNTLPQNLFMSLLNLTSHNKIGNIQNNTLDLILSNLSHYKISKNKFITVQTELTDGLVKPDPLHQPLLTSVTIKRAQKERNQLTGELQFNFKKADSAQIKKRHCES